MLYVDALNLNIDNIDKYTRDEIKNIYKKIALECHPDKLTNISDENERTIRIERFKKASIGYKNAIDDFDNYGKLMYRNTDYDYDNLSDDSNDVTFEFLSEQENTDYEISGYNNNRPSRSRFYRLLRMLKKVGNKY